MNKDYSLLRFFFSFVTKYVMNNNHVKPVLDNAREISYWESALHRPLDCQQHTEPEIPLVTKPLSWSQHRHYKDWRGSLETCALLARLQPSPSPLPQPPLLTASPVTRTNPCCVLLPSFLMACVLTSPCTA